MTIGRAASIIVVLLIGALAASGQTKPRMPPRFEDYPASAVFEGKPALPKIVTSAQRQFRTRISEGVEKGWGVNEGGDIAQNKPGPNFAGDMIFIQWGCGAPCLMAAMVNAHTGEVYPPPLALEDTLGLPLLVIGNSVPQNPVLKFRRNSRLMVISATPSWLSPHPRAYRHYFAWESNRWMLVYREALD